METSSSELRSFSATAVVTSLHSALSNSCKIKIIVNHNHLIFKISDYLQVVEDPHDLEGNGDAEGGRQQHEAAGHLAAGGHQQGEDPGDEEGDADEDGGQVLVDGAVRRLEDLDGVLHDYVDPGKLK